MKICLDARVSDQYLKRADEIKVQNRDLGIMPDLIEKYPDAILIAQYPVGTVVDWALVKEWKILSKSELVLCLSTIKDIKRAVELDIPCFCGFPVKTFHELRVYCSLGVCDVRLAPPLTFDLDRVTAITEAYGVKLRAIPNVCFQDDFPHENGVYGSWIRPEDLSKYNEYYYVAEFDGVPRRKEEALYRIYFEEMRWDGPMDMIFEGFAHEAQNSLVPDTLAERRLNCGHRCQVNGICSVCKRELNLSIPSAYSPEVLASLKKLKAERDAQD